MATPPRTDIAPRPGGSRPPRRGGPRPRYPGRHLWRRFLLGGTVIVVTVAAATIAAGLLEVKSAVDALHQNPQLKIGGILTPAGPGDPQTLLLIGSDKRGPGAGAEAQGPGRSDTMLLIRIDPGAPATTMLSVPRDLQVTLTPPGGQPTTEKLNAAYAFGGARLATETIQRELGIPINHVIDIDFKGFRRAVDFVGCVDVQVDRPYEHSNAGLPQSEWFAEIHIPPGYQPLCGQQALDYVRYRHTDTDLVRSARQQDFLRQAKDELGTSGIVDARKGLERILGRAALTDIRSTGDVLELLELAIKSAGHPVRQVPFQATVGPSYVTATPEQLASTVNDFLDEPATAAAGTGSSTPPATTTAPGTTATAPPPVSHRPPAPPPVVPTPPSDLDAARVAGRGMPFPIEAPRARDRQVATPQLVRRYALPDRNGHGHGAYVLVNETVDPRTGDPAFYDVQGTTWTDPPILREPTGKLKADGRTYELFSEGGRLRLVAWREHGAAYWVANTLQNALTNRELIAIARSTGPL